MPPRSKSSLHTRLMDRRVSFPWLSDVFSVTCFIPPCKLLVLQADLSVSAAKCQVEAFFPLLHSELTQLVGKHSQPSECIKNTDSERQFNRDIMAIFKGHCEPPLAQFIFLVPSLLGKFVAI